MNTHYPKNTDDRPFHQLSAAEQDALMREAGDYDNADHITDAAIPPTVWADIEASALIAEEIDDYVEGREAEQGGEQP